MATVYTHMPMDQAIVNYAKQRIRELAQAMRAAADESNMWIAIMDQQGLCMACNGDKTMRVQDAQDESHTETCDICKGTGKAAR